MSTAFKENTHNHCASSTNLNILSSLEIFADPKTKEVVHSITGSRFRDPKHKWRDIRSDIGIALGTSRLGKRTKEVKSIVKKAKDKFKNFDHTLTGHSLGAKVSQNVSKSLGIPAVTFNIGSGPLGVVTDKIAKIFGADHKDSHVIHYTTNSLKNKTVDPLSVSEAVAGDANETNVVKTKGSDHAHSLSHFGAGKKKNQWHLHLSKVRSKNPSKSYKECLQLASSSYSK